MRALTLCSTQGRFGDDRSVVASVTSAASVEGHLLRKDAREAFKWKQVGFEAVGFELGYTCVTPQGNASLSPSWPVGLLSFLNFREETRTKQARPPSLVTLCVGTHVYPKSNPIDPFTLNKHRRNDWSGWSGWSRW